MEKYIIEEGKKETRRPREPRAEDYHNLEETEEERRMRIYLYSEVVEND